MGSESRYFLRFTGHSLALGIGANVVVFGVLNAVLLHPLEVSAPQNLYQMRHTQWTMGTAADYVLSRV